VKPKHRLESKRTWLFGGARSFNKLIFPIIILVVIKIGYSVFLIKHDVLPTLPSVFTPSVSAQEESDAGDEAAERPQTASTDNETGAAAAGDHYPAWSYNLIVSLQKREERVNIRENELATQEAYLRSLKKEIEERIEYLRQVEKKITDLVEVKKTVEDEKLRKLAKVFEETPPEQAGPLLSQLDVDIAAQLILKMNGRKAGKMWGYVDPKKAVEISKKLAQLKPELDINRLEQTE